MLREFQSNYSSVVEAVFDHGQKKPDSLSFIHKDEKVTYGQFMERILLVYSHLKTLGIKKGDRILLESSQDPDYFAILLAIQLQQAILVPLEKRVKARTAEHIYEEVGGSFLILKESLDTGLDFIRYEDLFKEQDVEKLGDFPKLDDVCEVLFTTGSTGKSKGIVLTNKNNIALAQNVIYGVEMKENNMEIIPTPTSHSHGLRRTYANLVNGSTVILLDGVMNLKAFFKYLDTYPVTSIDLTPSAFQVIYKLSKDRLGDYKDQLDYVQFGSAKLSEKDKEVLRGLLPHVRLYDFYGSTEAGCSCVFDFNEYRDKKNCIGKPSYNSEFVCIDPDQGQIFQASPDQLGLLASRGHMTMKTYWGMEPDEVFNDQGFIETSDLGYIDKEGFVYMYGRNDFIINYGGIKINPEELETILYQFDGFLDCAVQGEKDSLGGEVPIVLYSLEEGDQLNQDELRDFLNQNIDQNKVPKKFIQVDEIPRAENGKILRKELRKKKDGIKNAEK